MSDTSTIASPRTPDPLAKGIDAATKALLDLQRPDGHWVFELEADATIPAEYVLLRHYLGEDVDRALEAKIGNLSAPHPGRAWRLAALPRRRVRHERQREGLFRAQDDRRSRRRRRTCSARARPFSRAAARPAAMSSRAPCSRSMASCRGAPCRSCRSRSCCCRPGFRSTSPRFRIGHERSSSPLLVLQAHEAESAQSERRDHRRIVRRSRRQICGLAPKAPHQKWFWFIFFRVIDTVLRAAEPLFPARTRKRAIDKAVAFVTERLNGEDGLGAIFPAMANTVMMFDVLGYPRDHPDVRIARALDRQAARHQAGRSLLPALRVAGLGHGAHLPCAAGSGRRAAPPSACRRASIGSSRCRCSTSPATGSAQSPGVRPGGWAFQYANPHYPDLDDTAVVVMAMDRAEGAMDVNARYRPAIERAREWIVGLQSRNGGWAAFDANNDHEYLNNIPFSDHGALLDPPTADLTARCLSMLAQLGEKPATQPGDGARDRLPAPRPASGRKLVWTLGHELHLRHLVGAVRAQCRRHRRMTRRKSARRPTGLISIQNPDGGWGEDGTSYKLDYRGHEAAPRTASQTAWALLGLMAAGETDHPAVERGIAYLLRTQGARRLLGRAAFHRDRFPARLLSALSRLSEILPALGAGALPQPEGRQHARRRVRHVSNAVRPFWSSPARPSRPISRRAMA